ncbi:response regulator transcription factor [Sporolactobacillus terrae]|jgi:DNA-binding response OmpR family regulator|uniref:DNA-binding response regulator n=1 Tax=Sporolactobacillus terrae TaxID=269673 RepID=A0A410DBR7_9BACL|nr:response regulator transcription factor [Sporolactobacillus terrae]QAA23581.1 DNA-binding response regulator [Sporolactobacillus terrae]QAA26551.1 DNA-binding response regulator [Sporolactobacillus terrae]UAK15624.1 response regulator transcription factor [Sporolactobacillus terrae]BBO00085.1 DNA-binding response regulator [Sporolactobacillus terrae]
MRLLAVEDNTYLRQEIVRLLQEDYTVDSAEDGDEALYQAEQNIYDAIILDVMLPGLDGFEVTEQIRKKGVETPIIFLTARDAVDDRVKGLNLGGDDYIVKPFQNQELKARIAAILRRSSPMSLDHILRYKGIAIDNKRKQIKVDGDLLSFTTKQYDLLEYLVQNEDQILTREQIFDRIWGFDSDTTVGIVEVYIHQLRKKLKKYAYDADIHTVRGIGYMLTDK